MQYSLQGRIAKLGCALLVLITLTSFAGGQSALKNATGNAVIAPTGRSVTLADLPKPEPLIFEDIGAQTALALNSAIPLSTKPNFAAAPFRLTGTVESQDRAIDCLASAMWYEAGGDGPGQLAVAQVILNRVRHPAYPNSVCGVVFQGTERKTGCQFTYTCDGALRRTPSATAWTEARARAMTMLSGSIFEKVGLATHYHTNWVHPVWSAKLEKIVEIQTHLFFRWSGKWGRLSSMFQPYAGVEAGIPKLARISLAHRAAATDKEVQLAEAALELAVKPVAMSENSALTLPTSSAPPPAAPGVFTIDVASSGNGGASAMKALSLCGGDNFCKVIGWAENDGAKTVYAPANGQARGAIAFLYVRDRRTGVDRAFWDCSRFARQNADQCLNAENRRWIDFKGNFQADRVPTERSAT